MLEKYGLRVPEILLPDEQYDLSKWAVIACDQFTSEPAYWSEVERVVGDAPSALRLTLPEVYLEDNKSARVAAINEAMRAYADTHLCEYENAMILVRRTDSVGGERFIFLQYR